MEYWQIVFKRVWQGLPATVGSVVGVATIVLNVWGDWIFPEDYQWLPKLAFWILVAEVLRRIAVIPPQIWSEQKGKIQQLTNDDKGSKPGSKFDLHHYLGALLTQASFIQRRWNENRYDQEDKIRKFEALEDLCHDHSNKVVSDKSTFDAAHDAIEACKIVVKKTQNGEPASPDDIAEARSKVAKAHELIEERKWAPVISA